MKSSEGLELRISVDTTEYSPEAAFQKAVAKYENANDVDHSYGIALIEVQFRKRFDYSYYEWLFEIRKD